MWESSARRARRRAAARVATVDVPDPFDLEAFLQLVAAERGRTIQVLPLESAQLPDLPCGLWIAGEFSDWIFVEEGTSPLHREHIVLHEVAHMLCGHRLSRDTPSVLLPSLDPAVVRRVLGRTSYSDDQEREAEAVASLLLARARRRRSSAAPLHDALHRASRVLEPRRR